MSLDKHEQLCRLLQRQANCTAHITGRSEHPLERKYRQGLEELKKKHFGRKKDVPPDELMAVPEIQTFSDSIRQRASQISAQLKRWHAILEKEVFELASSLDPPVTDTPLLFFTSSASDFSSQTRPKEYAKCWASLYAVGAERLGLTTEVRHEIREFKDKGLRLDRYEVWVNSTLPAGKCIVEHRQLPLRDKLKFILQNNCNVRVFYPLLPYGTEEKLGLDDRGNDIVKVDPNESNHGSDSPGV